MKTIYQFIIKIMTLYGGNAVIIGKILRDTVFVYRRLFILLLPLLLYYCLRPGVAGSIWFLPALLLSLSIPTLGQLARIVALRRGCRRQAVYTFLALFAELLLITRIEIALLRQIPHSGLPLSDVDSFTALVIEDSSFDGVRNSRVQLRLLRVADSRSQRQASAGGWIVLYSDNFLRLYSGAVILVEAPLSFNRPRAASDLVQTLEFTGRIHHWRAAIKQSLFDKLGNDPAAGLLRALLFGDSAFLELEIKQLFTLSGCAHILALSGMHLAIIAGLWQLLLRKIVDKRLLNVLIAVFILFYIFFIGFRASLLRAALLYLLSGVLKAVSVTFQPPALLALTAVIESALYPHAFYSLSFQLSFAALAGIFLLAPAVIALLPARLPRSIAAALAAGTAAQLATAPLLLRYFEIVYPIGIIASLVLTPLITLFMSLAIISLPAVFLGFGQLVALCRLALSKLYVILTLTAEIAATFGGISGIAAVLTWAVAAVMVTMKLISILLRANKRRIRS